MNKTQQILSVLFLLASVFLLNSCKDDDSYEFNPYKSELATINVIDSLNDSYYLTLNDGSTLWPAASKVKYKPLNNQRALINYTVLADSSIEYTYNIRINNISNIVTKQIEEITADNNAKFGNDPVKILTIGIGDNYLNIRFEIRVGGEQIKHSVDLVTEDFKLSNDTIKLEVKHNANNDPTRFGEVNYAAFDLRSIQAENKSSVNLVIKVKNYTNHIQEYILQYKY